MDNSSAAMVIEELRLENARLKEQVAELTAKVNWFMEQFKVAKHSQFGSSSEWTVSTKEPSLFNETEKEAEPELKEPTLRP